MLINIATPRSATAPGLVELLCECHQRIRRFSRLACDVATRGDLSPAEVTEVCVSTARYFREALPLHVADEDESLMPRLREYAPAVSATLDALREQHAQHEGPVARLLEALEEVQRSPRHAVARARLSSIAAPLKVDFEEHLALEERLVFPAIGEWLPAPVQALIIAELRARRRAATLVKAASR